MIVKNTQSFRGTAYTAPAVEEIAIETSRQILDTSLTIPDVTEENESWD